MQNNREIALEYIRLFCDGDVAGLGELLAAGLEFEGTLHTFHSRAEYLASLVADPPQKAGFEVVSVTGDDERVAIFYDYHKSGTALRLAQLFTVRERRIEEILLIFDGRGFG